MRDFALILTRYDEMVVGPTTSERRKICLAVFNDLWTRLSESKAPASPLEGIRCSVFPMPFIALYASSPRASNVIGDMPPRPNPQPSPLLTSGLMFGSCFNVGACQRNARMRSALRP